jgi:hypothetical protein
VMTDLNSVTTNLPADVDLESAEAINDAGWIVGFSCTAFCPDGKTASLHGFLLIPNS